MFFFFLRSLDTTRNQQLILAIFFLNLKRNLFHEYKFSSSNYTNYKYSIHPYLYPRDYVPRDTTGTKLRKSYMEK